MKWMLIIVVFGMFPVKTHLLFDNLDDCVRAENQVRSATTEAYQIWSEWAQEQGADQGSREQMMRMMGLDSPATCIPHAELANGE